MKYIIYARKSTESEERQVLSIESQISELREFAAKEKLEIVASLCEAQTAKEPGRMKFAEMLSFLEEGKADGITLLESGSSRQKFHRRRTNYLSAGHRKD